VVLNEHIGEGVPVIVRTRRIFFYGLLTMIPCVFLMDAKFHLGRLLEPINAGNIAFLAILATAGAYVTWNYAVARLGVMKSSVYIYLIPVITIICSAIILHEKITIGAVSGCLLTMAGLFLSEKKVKK
jgi:drug/metabolite transporter (DMT)-like permease